jgi:hypothetical protein
MNLCVFPNLCVRVCVCVWAGRQVCWCCAAGLVVGWWYELAAPRIYRSWREGLKKYGYGLTLMLTQHKLLFRCTLEIAFCFLGHPMDYMV